MPHPPTSRPRAALWLVLGLLAFTVLRADTRSAIFGNRGLDLFHLSPDFMVYYTAGERLNDGAEIYNGGLWGILPFTYPPFAGLAFRLLPHLPPENSAIVWAMICAGALVAVAVGVLVERGWRPDPGTVTLGILAAIGALALASVRESFFYGQINLILMLLVSLDFLRRRDRLTGIGVGIAAGLKLTPAFFILVMLVQRRFRDAATATITFIITVVLGLIAVPDATRFWTSAIFDDGRIGTLDNPGAQSLKSMVVRWFGHEGMDTMLVWLLAVAIVLAACVVIILEATRRGNNALVMSIGGITACLVSPFTWHHHWVWLVPLALCIIDLGIQVTTWFYGRATHETTSARWAPQLGVLVGAAVAAVAMLPYLSTSYAFKLSFWWLQGKNPIVATWYTWQGALIVLIAAAIAMWLRRQAGQTMWLRKKDSPREKLPVTP